MYITEILARIIVGIVWLNLVVQFIANYVIYPFYVKYGWFKGYYHDMVGCHIPDEDTILICRHGIERHAICKYCGKGIK